MNKTFSYIISLRMLKILLTSCLFVFFASGLFAQKKAHLDCIEVGMTAPDFELPTVSGEVFKLSDLRGKVVLLNFWASWCAPCRKKAPELLDLYDKFHDEEFEDGETGFEIVSVSLDRDQTAWESSIQKDQTGSLLNVGDMKGWKCEAALAYSIKRIPTMVLINGDGEIIALDPGTKDLSKKLRNMKKSRWFW